MKRQFAPEMRRDRLPSNNEHDPQTENVVRDLVLILGVVFAALQVLPSYVSSKNLLAQLIIFTLAFGAFGFLLLRFAKRLRIPGWKSIFLVVLFMASFGFALYSQYSLQRERATIGTTGPLKKYLNDVFDEHSGQWDAEFEKRYARPTLFQLTEAALRLRPDHVQERILRWRTGVKLSPDYFMGLSCFAQRDRLKNENSDKIAENAEKFLYYVSRPLADSDLLNKRQSMLSRDAPADDDIPYRVLVLGDPAAGKSSMLDRLDMIQARRARGSKEEPVPVLIKLKGIDAPSREILLTKIRERLGAAADVTLRTRTIILLIDALDESSDPRKAAHAIHDLLTESEIKDIVDRTIVTARVLEYSVDLFHSPEDLTSSHFKTVLLYGLDQTAIEKQILTSKLTFPQKNQVLQKLTDANNGQIWLQFLRLPMNFDLISEIMAQLDSNDIPRVPSEVVERFVKRRFKDKGVNPSDSEDCQNILSRVAAALLTDVTRRSRPFSTEDFVSSARTSQGMTPVDPDALQLRLQQIEKTGLIRRESRTTAKYQFFHLNLQDYFGARGLSDISVIEPKDVAWRQVILFRAGMKGGDSIAPLIKQAHATLALEDDANRKEKEAYLEQLQLEVDSIRSAVRSTNEN